MTRVLAVFAAAALLLSGCAGGTGNYSAATATALQQHVLAVSDAASDGDAEAALTRLDELATSARTALARGTLTEERGAGILSAIELVRADLEAMLEEKTGDGNEEAPAEEPADTGNSGSGTSGGNGNSGDNGNSGEGNSGNGNGNGGSDEETEAPAKEKPVDEDPVDEEPVDEEPVDEEPADEEPVDEEPADEEPADEEPADEEPADEEPAQGTTGSTN